MSIDLRACWLAARLWRFPTLVCKAWLFSPAQPYAEFQWDATRYTWCAPHDRLQIYATGSVLLMAGLENVCEKTTSHRPLRSAVCRDRRSCLNCTILCMVLRDCCLPSVFIEKHCTALHTPLSTAKVVKCSVACLAPREIAIFARMHLREKSACLHKLAFNSAKLVRSRTARCREPATLLTGEGEAGRGPAFAHRSAVLASQEMGRSRLGGSEGRARRSALRGVLRNRTASQSRAHRLRSLTLAGHLVSTLMSRVLVRTSRLSNRCVFARQGGTRWGGAGRYSRTRGDGRFHERSTTVYSIRQGSTHAQKRGALAIVPGLTRWWLREMRAKRESDKGRRHLGLARAPPSV